MRSTNVLFSAVHLLITLLVLSLGLLFVISSYVPDLQLVIGEFIATGSSRIFFVGLSIFIFGLSLFLGFYHMHKRAYYTLKMEAVAIEERVILETIKHYWHERLANPRLGVEVVMRKKGVLEFLLELPSSGEEVRESVVTEIQALLNQIFSYKKPFYVTFFR